MESYSVEMSEPSLRELQNVFHWASPEQLQEIIEKKLYKAIDYGVPDDDCHACGA